MHSPKKQLNLEQKLSKSFEDVKKEKKTDQSTRDLNSSKNQEKDNVVENEITGTCSNNAQDKLLEASSRSRKKSSKVDFDSGRDKKKGKVKENPFPEFMSAFPPLPGVKDDVTPLALYSRSPERYQVSKKAFV